MSKIIEGIAKDLKSIPEKFKAKTGNVDKKKLFLMNLPYVLAAMFCICSTCENVAYWDIYSVFEVGSKGSWYFICATKSCKKASLSMPFFAGAFLTELSDAVS